MTGYVWRTRSFLWAIVAGLIVSTCWAAPPQKVPARWHTDLLKAHKVAVSTKKPLLLVFGQKSCLYCRKLESVTLANAEVKQMIFRDFVPVKLDLERDAKVARILEVEAVPCTIVLTPEADLVGRIVGYLEPPAYQRQLRKAQQLRARLERVRQAGLDRARR